MMIFADVFGEFMFWSFMVFVLLCWAVTAATKKAVDVAKKVGEGAKEALKDPEVRAGIGLGMMLGRRNNWWQ
jgi:hypothetical protein